MELIRQLFTDYTLQMVAMGSATLGIVSGGLGTYAVLRGQSLLGDAISHAALPGIAVAFLLTGSKAPLVLMAGAAAAGWLATLLIMSVTETTRIKYDSMLGLMLSVFFGVGLVLLTFIQHRSGAGQAGLDTFLFGQAAALVERDVVTMAVLGGGALVLMALFWKELKVLSFDPEFGRTMGMHMRAVDILLTTLLVVAIVIGLQTVGVVLMSAMIIAPAAAGRQWTDGLGKMVALSAAFGAAAGVSGALISSTTAGLPTGPTIVLCMGVIVIVSIFFAPNRGLVWARVRARRSAGRFHREAVLMDLHELGMQHGDPFHPHEAGALEVMSVRKGSAVKILERLREAGFVRQLDATRWALTSSGVEKARALKEKRT
ncbi:MAG: metal ABC transporter permease [Rhodothermales bacterium]